MSQLLLLVAGQGKVHNRLDLAGVSRPSRCRWFMVAFWNALTGCYMVIRVTEALRLH